MANSRVITSAIWEDEWFGPLGFFEQALWIGLFSKCADDQGRLLDNAILIRAAIFPYKDVSIEAVNDALGGFESAGRIHRYEADGKRLIQVLHWWSHQPQQWASASKWAAPGGWIDHVRTRENNQYHTENWKNKAENAADNANWQPRDSRSGERVSADSADPGQVGGHIPIPVPVPVPIPVPEEESVTPAPKPAPKKRAKRPSRADPRTKHPAIQCVKGIMETDRNPPAVLYDDFIKVLGESPDGPKLARCYKAWVGRGFKANNYAWALEWYANGIPAHGPTRASPGNNGHAQFTDPSVYEAAGKEWADGK